ncbi:hypothetical protein CDL15_Pgr018914 [Punica granatum]|uniref:Uncharacterized protein n=1 Tax=Punica granatum TaxID=22663 RepID=A0A218WLZ1_PUNGR|nr:hypothetical protein CDL15_Pgr018914 [Punica granatum]
MDPRLPPSKRFYQRSSSHDFKFDFPTSQAPLTLVHADELFSGGYVLPIFADPLKIATGSWLWKLGSRSQQWKGLKGWGCEPWVRVVARAEVR